MKRRISPALVGIVIALALSLSTCASLSSAFSVDALFGTAMGAAAGNEGDQAKMQQLVAAGKAVGAASQEINPEEEYYIGRAVAATVLSRYKPWTGPAANDYVNRLGSTLAMASALPETFGGYHFLVLDSDEINAFGAPGGLILVSRGLLECATSEDEVAAIFAHEIGHVSLKHGLKAIGTARWTEAALEIAKYAAQNSDSAMLRDLTSSFGGVIGDIVTTLINSGYSQDLEKEADLEALAILRNVGYDPGALARVLATMKTRLKPGSQDFAKTHPSPDARIAYIKKAMAAMKPAPRASALAASRRQARWQAALAGL